MTQPQGRGEQDLFRESAEGMAVEHPLIPFVVKTLDVRNSGFLKASRRGFAGIAISPPAAPGTNIHTHLYELPNEHHTVKLYQLTVVLFDNLTDPDPNIEDPAMLGRILTPVNIGRVVLMQPPFAEIEPADEAKAPIVVAVPAAGARQQWIAGYGVAPVLLDWVGVQAVQRVTFDPPLVIHGVRGATGERAGLRVIFDVLEILNDVTASAVYLDFAHGAESVNPR